jgi:hypothetical protein
MSAPDKPCAAAAEAKQTNPTLVKSVLIRTPDPFVVIDMKRYNLKGGNAV